MFIIKKIACRAFQTAFRAALPLLPYREPKILSACSDICGALRNEGCLHPLVVTDSGIISNGLAAYVEKALREGNIEYTIYSETQPNPTVSNVEQALVLYKNNRCDSLIAIGGGSAIDCAKAIGARAVYPKKPLSKMGGILRVMRKLPTLIAVPTTAGTGSETTLAAVITDSEKHHKYALMSFPLIPHYAVLDPKLTCTLPPHLTATTGMDALTHAVEAYIGRSTSRETRRLALEAAELIFENIETAYSAGNDLRARRNMLIASYKAGVAFSKSYVGYIHAIAHSLGGKYGTPHGLANAVIMPYVLEEYGECIYKKLHRLAVHAGVCLESDTYKDGAERFIFAIRQLNTKMQIPEKISGIKEEDIPEMASRAEKEANPLYPVPRLMTRKELEKFYYKAGENLEK